MSASRVRRIVLSSACSSSTNTIPAPLDSAPLTVLPSAPPLTGKRLKVEAAFRFDEDQSEIVMSDDTTEGVVVIESTSVGSGVGVPERESTVISEDFAISGVADDETKLARSARRYSSQSIIKDSPERGSHRLATAQSGPKRTMSRESAMPGPIVKYVNDREIKGETGMGKKRKENVKALGWLQIFRQGLKLVHIDLAKMAPNSSPLLSGYLSTSDEVSS